MIDSLFDSVLLTLVAGSCAGFLAGLFGIGGGIVVVPVLYHLLVTHGVSSGTAIGMAVATSLCCIIPTAVSSVRAHHRLQNIDWQYIRSVYPALMIGAVAGALTVAHFHSGRLKQFFAALLLVVAVVSLVRVYFPQLLKPRSDQQLDYRRSMGRMSGMFAVALISALAGVGGGALGGPLLLLQGFKAHRAIGTAACFGFIISLPAVVVILVSAHTPADAPVGSFGLVNIPAFLILASCSILVAPIGAKVGKKLSHKLLSSTLALLLFLLSLKMLLF